MIENFSDNLSQLIIKGGSSKKHTPNAQYSEWRIYGYEASQNE